MDPFEFRKDGQLLARLSGASELGPFTAFEKMQVTAEGRRRGYFDLACGELVHTPQSKMQQHVRVQLPLRKGMLFRILLGQRKAGAKKKSTTQNNLICLSYVESHSAYRAEINNPLGLYEWRRKKVLADPEADFLSGPFFERPLKESKFCWVLTSALCTSPDGWIQRMNPNDDFDGDFPADGRIYTFDLLRSDRNEGDFIQDYTQCGILGNGDPFFDLAERTFASYTIPSSIETALGQAKRAMVASSHNSSVGKTRKAEATPAEPAAKSRRGSSSRTVPRRASSARSASGAVSARRASAAVASAISDAAESEEEWGTEDEEADEEEDAYAVDDALSTPPSLPPSSPSD